MAGLNKKDIREGLIFGGILIGIFVIIMWVNPNGGFTLKDQILYTSICIVGLIFGTWQYNYQGRLDESEKKSPKLYSGYLRVGGAFSWLGFLQYRVFSIIGLIIGVAYIIFAPSGKLFGLIFIGFGIAQFFLSKKFKKMSEAPLSGRVYEKE